MGFNSAFKGLMILLLEGVRCEETSNKAVLCRRLGNTKQTKKNALT
jgi:hypothetical protein